MEILMETILVDVGLAIVTFGISTAEMALSTSPTSLGIKMDAD